jgi:hypothetical protein
MRAGRRHRGHPVSLFSFQDIITCLCGIMILITLLMAISISANASRTPESHSADKASTIDNQALRDRVADLQSTLSELNAAPVTPDPVKAAQERLDLARRVQEQAQQRDALLSELRITERRRDKESATLDALTNELSRLQSQKQQLQSEIQVRRPSHTIAIIPGNDTAKIPVVIECSAELIRISRLGYASVHTVGTGDEVEMLARIKLHLAQYPSSSHYVVFMIKPSGFLLYQLISMYVETQGYEIGYDVIGEDSAISYAERPG